MKLVTKLEATSQGVVGVGSEAGIQTRVQRGGSMADEAIVRICVAGTYLFTVPMSIHNYNRVTAGCRKC